MDWLEAAGAVVEEQQRPQQQQAQQGHCRRRHASRMPMQYMLACTRTHRFTMNTSALRTHSSYASRSMLSGACSEGTAYAAVWNFMRGMTCSMWISSPSVYRVLSSHANAASLAASSPHGNRNWRRGMARRRGCCCCWGAGHPARLLLLLLSVCKCGMRRLCVRACACVPVGASARNTQSQMQQPQAQSFRLWHSGHTGAPAWPGG